MKSTKSDILLFIKKSSFIVLPMLVLIGLPTYVMVTLGELVSIDKVIDLQKGNKRNVLLGLAYSNSDVYYKLTSVIKRQPDIIALGSSRVLCFSPSFFTKKVQFFNAGLGVSKLHHFSEFLEKIPDTKEPKVILMGVDQYYFNDNFNKNFRSQDNYEQSYHNGGSYVAKFKKGYTAVYDDFLNGKLLFRDINRQDNSFETFGLNARIHAFGFRNDGCIQSSDPYNKNDHLFQDTFRRIEKGVQRFEYGKELSEKSLHELDKFLSECKKRNIYVVGFLPPFANSVVNKIHSMKDKYSYLSLLSPEIQPIFSKYNFNFFDYTDISSLGAQDIEFIDGFHGCEKAYLRLFINMVENDTHLQKIADVSALKLALKQAKNDCKVFE
ncbi:hypothetical protein QNI19_26670 [Cytophagaceae bacterium DM2B3-1]|uniref:SGNH/GDSL hydrolase family protein n=1 Tax=Xanthocytophaga flava TaxID=3048013 RepID=A0ABT7CS12_9BACT|nr:hypothetical protein [Xanthocytophaga flavus]MDJ1496546.1 hypothetical protein [Xanthocytophaga flavus]